ncbi:MAG: LysR family transcriptional regulator [Proteobacteria bacterium]|jgi:DNA-binding transcriptional LysR family regulator|nr:LysR family transcriptional regulator [Pseudomonadota bacterium]
MEYMTAIPVYVAVVECGSFSAAATRLGLTKSAVSKRILQLEAQLGTRLLQRTTRRQSLTEAGESYYDYARQALALAREGADFIAGLQQQPQGLLRISVPMAFGRLHLSPLVPAFLHAHPAVQLDMVMDDQMVDLIDGGFDLAIRIGHLPESEMIARRIAPCKSVLCASPDYLAKHGHPLQPLDLLKHNCIQYSYYRGGTEWIFAGPAGANKVLPRGNYQVNNSEALRDALLAGLGICHMPSFVVGADLAAGRLVTLLDDYPLPRYAIYAVFPERKHVPAKVRAFLDFIDQQQWLDAPYWDIYPDEKPL